MNSFVAEKFVEQALAMAMNYHKTQRPHKALEVVAQAKKIAPDNHLVDLIWNYLLFGGPRHPSIKEFTGDWWYGESLEDKSIEVFCDQGMGDTINCLRYLKLMRGRWGCRIVLNCYAFFHEFERLMRHVSYVDEFVQLHKPCDYYINILSLPTLLHEVAREVYYPANWQSVLDMDIPEMPVFEGIPSTHHSESAFRIGLAHCSNAQNEVLAAKKSVALTYFARFEDGINELWSVSPSNDLCNFMIRPQLTDLLDTASVIAGLDAVVSVDTATLHLAGAMGKPTLGILPSEADARWGLGSKTVWYPSVELFRQNENLEWDLPIQQAKERLVALRDIR